MIDDRVKLFNSYMEVILEKEIEIMILKKKLDDAEKIGESVLNSLAKEMSRYADSGDWLCQNRQFIDRVLLVLGGKSWRIDLENDNERRRQEHVKMVMEQYKSMRSTSEIEASELVSERDEEVENS